MTSLRQIESNRRNAQKSTGPKTDTGKERACQNAVRHGLTAETVITPLEDPEDYKAFEEAITADYDAETAVERELVLRLASLLWRLRRATSIETGLLQIQGEIQRDLKRTAQTQLTLHGRAVMVVFRQRDRAAGSPTEDACGNDENRDAGPRQECAGSGSTSALPTPDARLDVARCFLRLANFDNGVFERLGRYEAALWRQVRQTVFTLERLRLRRSGASHARTQRSWFPRVEAPPEADW